MVYGVRGELSLSSLVFFQEVSFEGGNNFAAVTARTAAPAVLLLVLGQAEEALGDIDWMINRLKTELLVKPVAGKILKGIHAII